MYSARFLQKGFTIVELIVALAILSVVSTIGVGAFYSFRNHSNIEVAATTYAQAMRRAQGATRAMQEDSVWGVRVESGSVVLFKGASYASRTQSADRVFPISGTNVSGLSEVTFAKLTGYPAQTGTTTIASSEGASITVSINAKGAIAY